MMGFLFEPRIPMRLLASFCRRVSTQLGAGVDLRAILKREHDSAADGALRRSLDRILAEINQGSSWQAALQSTGRYFPRLFHDLVHLGEQTGRLDSVLEQLATYYEHRYSVRRGFLAAIAWPVIQLCLAILVVGFLIWILGAIAPAGGKAVDILGLGLTGNNGLFLYCVFWGCVAGGGYAVYHAIRSGALWGKHVQILFLKIPALGGALKTLALARVAWAMNLTFGAGMDVLQCVRLSLSASGNAYYTESTQEITDSINNGQSIYEAFSSTRKFPHEFLDTLQAGEQGGRITESMGLLSRQYQQYAQEAIKVLSTIGGFAVWAVVAGLIIVMIFRLFFFYLNTITSLT